MKIQDGRYSLIYPSGDYRTLQIKTLVKGGLAGKTILAIKTGHRFEGIAFLNEANNPSFWGKFRLQNPEERLERIRKAVDRVAADPQAAGLAYALKENRCCRCGKELTVPASIHNGMGPDCAQKYAWTKTDQQAAYNWAAQQHPAA